MAHVGGPLSEARTNALFTRLLAEQAPFYRAWRVLCPDDPVITEDPAVSDHTGAIGHVALMRHGLDALELGFLVHVSHWGRGYAAEAAGAVLAHARSQPDHPRILATVDPDHTASIRVLEKIRMRRDRVAYDAAGAYYIYAAT